MFLSIVGLASYIVPTLEKLYYWGCQAVITVDSVSYLLVAGIIVSG